MSNTTLMEMLARRTEGEYDILWELGAGGMATVFAAHDRSLDRSVAIKVLSPRAEILAVPGIVERFLDEARIVANLRHPNVVTIHSVGSREGLHYFVMEYIGGRTLKEILAPSTSQHRPTLDETIRILSTLARALDFAHERGVVHRDVKPANIMIEPDGRVVLMDFGIARVIQAPGLTQPGMTMGTPAYMSPEQCSGTTDPTGFTDQYSLGVVAYEMVAGVTPFVGPDVQVMYEQVHVPPVPLSVAAPHCPTALAATIDRMLAKRPTDRWPTLATFAAAIERCVVDLSDKPRAMPHRTCTNGLSLVRHHRLAVAASSSIVLVITVAIVTAVTRRRDDRIVIPHNGVGGPAIVDGNRATGAPVDSVAAELRGQLAQARALSERGEYALARQRLGLVAAQVQELGPENSRSIQTDSLVADLVAARAENTERCRTFSAIAKRRGLTTVACE